jgi:hypothetical protein
MLSGYIHFLVWQEVVADCIFGPVAHKELTDRRNTQAGLPNEITLSVNPLRPAGESSFK